MKPRLHFAFTSVAALIILSAHFTAVAATAPAESLTLLPGFKAELIRVAQKGEGSWVSLTIDPKGRLIISPQEGLNNLLRVTLSPEGQVAKVEKIAAGVGGAMGLLYAFDSLYVSGNGPGGLGLYRLRDTKGTDQFDETQLLRKFDGAGGEHGSHGLVLGPDQKIYYIHGNFAHVPSDVSPQSPHRNFAEDLVLPRQNDGNGFGNGIKPPGGFLLRMDPDAKNVELFAAGMRNTYDFAINPDGEIIGFDSDMEWDWGTPWYRPIRICHLVSGADFGFREGTGKWPTYYPDSLPPAVEVGIGSPTGLKFGTGARFPAKYQKALYAMDWTYGRLFAVHLTPKGASYSATYEPFVKGKPLNLTDLEIGHDGAMYFMTGGRGTESGLYRVTYAGAVEPEAAPSDAARHAESEAAQARALRHQLEAFHGKSDPAAIEVAWPHLSSPDRWIRYAARIAIESQDVALWQDRALAETNPDGSLTALLALARKGPKSVEKNLLGALGRLPAEELSNEQKLAALRLIEVTFARLGKPDEETAKGVINALDRHYGTKNELANRELCHLLVYLEAPDVVSKTLELLDAAPTQEEQLTYILDLRTLKTGWTMDQRKHYFSWFNRSREGLMHPPRIVEWFHEAGREYGDGNSFPGFIRNIRKDAVAALTDGERAELAPLITAGEVAAQPTPQRRFVKEWKTDDLLPALEQVSKGRSFRSGQSAFAAAQCVACHRFGNLGGTVGPDLTAISSRFTRRDVLESILEPSKVISDQYQDIVFTRKDGETFTGRIATESPDRVVIRTNPLNPDEVELLKSDITKREPSKISPMPEGLVSSLNKDEILDLLAYLESGGKQDHPDFTK